MAISTEITESHYAEVKPKLYEFRHGLFVVDALNYFHCGMLCFNDIEECYRCTLISVLTKLHISCYENIFIENNDAVMRQWRQDPCAALLNHNTSQTGINH